MHKISIANTPSQSAKPKCIPKPGNELKIGTILYHIIMHLWASGA